MKIYTIDVFSLDNKATVSREVLDIPDFGWARGQVCTQARLVFLAEWHQLPLHTCYR